MKSIGSGRFAPSPPPRWPSPCWPRAVTTTRSPPRRPAPPPTGRPGHDDGPSSPSPALDRRPRHRRLVKGNVVSLDLASTGLTIVKADGDTSGKTGHYHVFIDRYRSRRARSSPSRRA